ncbi:MAG: hypothetical protein IKR86_11625 [Candidatus Methanomethylophilaceae archaeon]|nr:hypothetical protein [Candidatus Methanomethylophilaceae archaeon]
MRVTSLSTAGASSRKRNGLSALSPETLQGNMTASVSTCRTRSAMSITLSSFTTGWSTNPEDSAMSTRTPSLAGEGGTLSTTISLSGSSPLMKLMCENMPRTTTVLPGNLDWRRASAGVLRTSRVGSS